MCLSPQFPFRSHSLFRSGHSIISGLSCLGLLEAMAARVGLRIMEVTQMEEAGEGFGVGKGFWLPHASLG